MQAVQVLLSCVCVSIVCSLQLVVTTYTCVRGKGKDHHEYNGANSLEWRQGALIRRDKSEWAKVNKSRKARYESEDGTGIVSFADRMEETLIFMITFFQS